MNDFYNLNLSDPDGKRNYPEDFAHENGNYLLRCYSCGEHFLGHKRRFTCKLCHDNPPDEAAKNIAKEKIKKSFTDAFERLKADCFNPNETDEQYFLRRKKDLGLEAYYKPLEE